MNLLVLFHFFLGNHHVIVSEPPKILYQYKTANALKDIYIDKNLIGTSEYDIKKSTFCTNIFKNGQKIKTLTWNSTAALEVFNEKEEMYRLDVLGKLNIYHIKNKTLNVWKAIYLDRQDFITTACMDKNFIFSMSFYNSMFLTKDLETRRLSNEIYTRNFLYAKKIKISRFNDGPMNILIHFQKGGLLLIKILIHQDLNDCNILQCSKILDCDNIKDFYFITNFKIVCHLSTNILKIININSLNIEKEIILDGYISDIYVNDNKELYVYHSQKKKWVFYK